MENKDQELLAKVEEFKAGIKALEEKTGLTFKVYSQIRIVPIKQEDKQEEIKETESAGV